MPDAFSFESQFRGAIRQRYRHEPVAIRRVLVLTDLAEGRAEAVRRSSQRFLAQSPALHAEARWDLITAADFPQLPALVDRVRTDQPDLIVASRNLGEYPRFPRNSLGTTIDALTQVADVPVLLLPVRQDADEGARELVDKLSGTPQVLVVTDHLTEDPQLIRWGAELTSAEGTLFLAHIEDQRVFERYMTLISKIPELDDDTARRTMSERLLKEASDFCAEAAQVLAGHRATLRVEPTVAMGEPIEVLRDWLAEHQVDLLVADAKDPQTAAMSAFTHTLAVEFVDTPMLLL